MELIVHNLQMDRELNIVHVKADKRSLSGIWRLLRVSSSAAGLRHIHQTIILLSTVAPSTGIYY